MTRRARPDPSPAARLAPSPAARLDDRLAALAPLLAAEAAAEAEAAGADPRDLEQAVWLRLLEHGGQPPGPVAPWLRAAVRAEARAFRRRARHEIGYGGDDGEAAGRHRAGAPSAVETAVLTAESRRRVRAAVAGLPGRCPRLLWGMMSRSDLTYREISQELGISQGSLGPLRSRCLNCLRARLSTEVEFP